MHRRTMWSLISLVALLAPGCGTSGLAGTGEADAGGVGGGRN